MYGVRADRMGEARIGQRLALARTDRPARDADNRPPRAPGSDASGSRKTERRIAGDQKQIAAAGRQISLSQPGLACAVQRCSGSTKPFGSPRCRRTIQDARALVRVVDLGIARIDVVRDQALLEHPVGRVLISRLHVIRHQAQRASATPSAKCRASTAEAWRLTASRAIKLFVAPDRHAVAAPVQRKGPARNRFARIPFALAVMQQTAGRETIAQPPDQFVGALALRRRRAHRCSIPPIDNRRPRRRSARRPW